MHAFLIISQNPDSIQKKIDEFSGTKIEFPFEKVGDVRELTKFTRLKVTEKTVIVLKNFDHSNEESQNAFLKSLEEPQDNLTYVLTSNNIDRVLPTIVSRCEVIELGTSNLEINENEKKEVLEFIDAGIGEKLKKISTINKRDEAISFIKNLILVGHEVFLEKPQFSHFLDSANKTQENLEANGNVQLQLTSFVTKIYN